jgi:WD40 repeat protein/serine/threonine protein kinase
MSNQEREDPRSGPSSPRADDATRFTTPPREDTRFTEGPDTDHTRFSAALPETSPTPTSPGPSATRDRHLPRRFGDYELLEEIARGGMGIVYKARQQIGGGTRVVALKMMRVDSSSAPEAVERFLLEARAAANLEHPNIVPIHDIGEVEGQYYFTMQLITGGSLHQRLAEGPLQPKEAAQLVRQVAEAVQHAHDHGLIHRDIKPHNILLADGAGPAGKTDLQLTPKLTDFGLVRTGEGGRSLPGMVLGTPSYMPPEQARGQLDRLGPASDVYGLGAVLYSALTGRPPFQSADPLQTLAQVCSDEPLPLRQLNPAVPLELEAVCLKCLQKEPHRRYPSAAELAEELARFQRGEPVKARPVSRTERCWRWCRRNPAVASLLAGILLSLLAGTGIATYFALQAEARAREREEARGIAAARATEADNARAAAERARLVAERTSLQVYLGSLSQAQRDWKDNRLGGAEQHLEDSPLKLRHWEWNYLKRLLHADQLTLRYDKPAHAVAYSRDGRYLASASGDANDPGQIEIRDGDNGDLLLPALKGHSGAVLCLAFAPDHKRLVSGSADGAVKFWDVATGKEAQALEGHTDAVLSLAFSSDGRRLASAGLDRTARIWDVATGKEVLTLRGHAVALWGVAFAPDDIFLATAGTDGLVKVWDTRTGKEVATCKGHKDAVLSVAFNPAGKVLASADARGEVKLWDPQTGRLLPQFSAGTGAGYRIAFSPDGKRLAMVHGLGISVRDSANGKELLGLRGHRNEVRALAYRPDGRRLASASADQTVKIWDVTRERQPLTLEGHSCAVYSGDGRFLATCQRNNCKVWDARTGAAVYTLQGHTRPVKAVAASPDGRRLATASRDRTVKLWDLGKGKEILAFSSHVGDVLLVAFSPDGRRIASADSEGMVRLWDASTGLEVWRKRAGEPPAVPACLGFDPRGRYLALAGATSVQLWDPATGKQARAPLDGHGDRVNALAFSPDGALLATASTDRTVKLWDLAGDREPRTLFHPVGGVGAVAFSPDGRRLVTVEAAANQVHLWDVSLGQIVFDLPAEQGAGVAFSPDGNRLAVASEEEPNRLWVWDGTPRRQFLTLHARGAGVAFDATGRRLAVACFDTSVKLCDTATGWQLRPLPAGDGAVFRVAFSPDGRRLAAAGDVPVIKLWNTSTWQEVLPPLEGHTDSVVGLAYSPDGKRIASASMDRTVRLWDAATGRPLRALRHMEPVLAISFSPDGRRLAAASRDHRVIIWDVENGEKVHVLEPWEFPGGVKDVAFSADGLRLAVATGNEVWLGDTRTWRQQRRLRGHTGTIQAVVFSPDGTRLLSAGPEQILRLWDVATGRVLLRLPGHRGGDRAVAFSLDGTKLATADGEAVRLWDVRPRQLAILESGDQLE